MRPRLAPAAPPGWIYALGGVAVLFVAVPVVGLLWRVPWARFWELITSESALTALRLSLATSVTAALLSLLLGLPLALWLAHSRSRVMQVVRSFVLIPLVLPPVVAGLALLYTFGRRGLIGQSLSAAGIEIAFTTVAVVIAQTYVSMPFVVMSLEGALAQVGAGPAELAYGFGASRSAIFWRITLPSIVPSLIPAAILALARSLGEFGATLTFAGSLEGVTRTMPLEVYLQRESDPDGAVALSAVLMVVAFLTVVLTYAWRRPGRMLKDGAA